MASEFEMNNGLNPQPTVKSDELEPNRDSKAHHCKLEIPSSSLKSAIFGQVEKYARYYMLSNIVYNISELCHLQTKLLENNFKYSTHIYIRAQISCSPQLWQDLKQDLKVKWRD